MKLWRRRDEWQVYSACGDSVDHICDPAPKDGSRAANVRAVKDICGSCRVRPECIQWAAREGVRGVWVAGRWVPVTKGKAKKVREELLASLPFEFKRRGDDV